MARAGSLMHAPVMSFNSMWSRSTRGRHKDRRRSKWLRRREHQERDLEVTQNLIDEDQQKRP